MRWFGQFRFTAAVSNAAGPHAFGRRRSRRFLQSWTMIRKYPLTGPCSRRLAVIDYGDCQLGYGNHQESPGSNRTRSKPKSCPSGAFLND